MLEYFLKMPFYGWALVSTNGYSEPINEKKGKFGFSIPIANTLTEFTLKMVASERSLLLITPIFNYERERIDAAKIVSGDYRVIDTGLYIGYRQYLKKTDIQTFIQPELGGLAVHRKWSFYSPEASNGSVSSLGLGGKLGFGAEYFISKSLSVEGIMSVNIQYIDYDLNETQKGKFQYASVTSEARLTWYLE